MVENQKIQLPLGGFIFLIVIAILFSGIALYGNASRGKEESKKSISLIDEDSLKTVMLEEALVDWFKTQGSTGLEAQLTNGIPDAYGRIAKSFKPDRIKTFEDAEAAVGLDLLTKKPIPDKVLKLLQGHEGVAADASTFLAGHDQASLDRLAAARPTTISERILRLGVLRSAGRTPPSGSIISTSAAISFVVCCLVAVAVAGTAALVLVICLLNNPNKLMEGGLPIGTIDRPTAERLATRAGIFFLSYMVLGITVGQVVRSSHISDAVSNLVSGVLTVGSALLAALIPLGGKVDLMAFWGKAKLGRSVGIALTGVGGNLMLLVLLAPIMQILARFFPSPVHPLNTEIANGVSPVGALVLLVVASFCAPFSEELVFRGMLLGAMTNLTGRIRYGLIAQAFIFAVVHPQGPAAWPGLMAIGAVAGIISYKTRSIWPGMVMHGLHNALVLALGLAITAL